MILPVLGMNFLREPPVVRTNAIRRAKNEAKVLDAISQIQSSKKKPTKAEVARITGISREQISRNYAHLFENM